MRGAISILVLLLATVSARAQAIVERVSAPGTVICGVGWTFPGSPPRRSPSERAALEYRLPEGPGLPTRNEPPDDSYKSPPSLPPSKPGPKKRAPTVLTHFEVENRGEKTIAAVVWEVVLRDAASGEEKGRLKFRTTTKVPPGKVVPQRHESPLDEAWQWLQNSLKRRAARVVVKIASVTYSDGTEWRK